MVESLTTAPDEFTREMPEGASAAASSGAARRTVVALAASVVAQRADLRAASTASARSKAG